MTRIAPSKVVIVMLAIGVLIAIVQASYRRVCSVKVDPVLVSNARCWQGVAATVLLIDDQGRGVQYYAISEVPYGPPMNYERSVTFTNWSDVLAYVERVDNEFAMIGWADYGFDGTLPSGCNPKQLSGRQVEALQHAADRNRRYREAVKPKPLFESSMALVRESNVNVRWTGPQKMPPVEMMR